MIPLPTINWQNVITWQGRCWLYIFVFATVASFLSGFSWVLDVISNFRVQYAIVLLVVGTVLSLAQDRNGSFCAFVAAGINFATILPLYIRFSEPAHDTQPVLRVLYTNVNYGNKQVDRLVQQVGQLKPDVVAVSECTWHWGNELKRLLPQYPYQKIETRPDAFGIALFSTRPLSRCEVVTWGLVPSIVAETNFDGAPVTILTTHPLPPTSSRYAALRNEQLRTLVTHRGELGKTLVVAADLNTTSWSDSFQRFQGGMGLFDTRVGFGVQQSWPICEPRWQFCPFLVPIDHVLVSPDLVTLNRKVCPSIGSDHLPVYVELARRNLPHNQMGVGDDPVSPSLTDTAQ